MSLTADLLFGRVAGFTIDLEKLREQYATLIKPTQSTPYRDNKQTTMLGRVLLG